jgi:two-component system sensor histidine kinase HydH
VEPIIPRLRRRVALFYNEPLVTTRKSGIHWSRFVLVGTIVFMGAALLLTVWITYRGVGNASEALVRGQASALQADLRGEFRYLEGAATNEDLEEILESYKESGLRYIAVVTRREFVAQAGSGTHDDPRALLRSVRRGEPTKYKGRIRLLLRAPGDRSGRRRSGGARPKGPPPIYIEFVPEEAMALRKSSTRSLMVGAGAAALLLLIAGVMMRWFVRQDTFRAQQENDRRLKSLGEMSAVLAHEIRNPLASLKGNAQILEKLIAKEGDPDSKSAGKAHRVVGEASRLEALINDLLNFAKSGELLRADVDPAALLQSCADSVPDGTIEVDVSCAPKTWSLDAARMQQVLSNLLTNAIQVSDRVSASVTEERGLLVYRVRDYGTGLDESDTGLLFEPFHTKKVNGTGLGLAVAKRLVELHSGTIDGSNAEGGGAEFRIEIPSE